MKRRKHGGILRRIKIRRLERTKHRRAKREGKKHQSLKAQKLREQMRQTRKHIVERNRRAKETNKRAYRLMWCCAVLTLLSWVAQIIFMAKSSMAIMSIPAHWVAGGCMALAAIATTICADRSHYFRKIAKPSVTPLKTKIWVWFVMKEVATRTRLKKVTKT